MAGPFTHGVGSFDPTDDSVLLWTRVEGVERLRWNIAPATDVAPVATGEVDVDPETNGCVAVEVGDLVPATRYRYWFEAGDRRSPVGRTRTLPAFGRDPFRIAVVCCADYSKGRFGVYRAVADADVELVLHVGDYIYESEGRGDVRPVAPARALATLDDYRTRFGQSRADADLRTLHQRHPVVAVWDDHDIADNAWRHGAKEHDPALQGPWEDRLAAATRAFREWVPVRLRDPAEPLAIWRSFVVGDLAELVVLDTRIWGRDEHADRESASPFEDPDRSLLGDDQRAWAHDRVRDRRRPWCLVASQVVVNPLQLPLPGGEVLSDAAPSGYAVVGGRAICTDEWDGYPAERDRLVAAMAERGRGTVVVSGDVHSAWAFEGPCGSGGLAGVPAGADGVPVAVEVVAPCVSSTPMAAHLPRSWRALAGELAERVPEARWFELERHGFVVLDVDAARVRADWLTVDIEDPDARPRPAASWVTRLDRPGRLEEAGGPGEGRAPDADVAVPDAAAPEPPAEAAGRAHRRRRRTRLAAGLGLLTGAALAVGRRLVRRARGA